MRQERTRRNEDRGVTGAVSGEYEKNAGDRISGLSRQHERKYPHGISCEHQ